MSIASFRMREVRKFRGALTAPDATAVPANASTTALNVEFNNDSAVTRTGFGDTSIAPGQVVSSMFNWVFLNAAAGQANFLAFCARSPYGGVKYVDLSTGTITDAYTVSGIYGATFTPHGARLYAGHFDSGLLGLDHARVITFSGGSTGAVDTCFARPLKATTEVALAATATTGGKVTPGTHYFGFIAERRSGYIGRPGPVDSSLVFSPTTASIASGVSNGAFTVTITPNGTWPADVVKVHLLMTTATNKARYLFIPGAKQAVSGGTAATFSVVIGDDDLVKNGDEATKYFGFVSQDGSGNPPFSPIATYRTGDRLAFAVNDANYPSSTFFSEKNNPQAVNVSKNIVTTPQYTHGGFELFGVTYMIGPAWTYSVQDNGNFPVTWAAPKLVDSAIGSPSPLGFAVNPSLGVAWVAAKSGLYRFSGGAYDPNPISRYQSEWATINWAAAAVRVVDDSVNKRVFVLAPTGSSTVADSLFVWDYTNGMSPEAVSFSSWFINFGAGGLIGASIAMVQNGTTKTQELWLGPASTLQPFRRKKAFTESQPFRDGSGPGVGIASAYETAPLLSGKGPTMLSQHHGDILRVTGSGTLSSTAYSLDRQKSIPLSNVTLSTTPDVWPLLRYYMLDEDVRLYLSNGGVLDAWFKLTAVQHLWTPNAAQRG